MNCLTVCTEEGLRLSAALAGMLAASQAAAAQGRKLRRAARLCTRAKMTSELEVRFIGNYMIFSFGKSWESISPTGSCLALTTIRSSMLRWLKILRASTTRAS